MKILFVIYLTLLTSLSLHGSSNKIILGTFGGYSDNGVADILLKEIEGSSKYEEFRNISKKNNIKTHVRPSDEYYILVIEPIKSKNILQKIMQIIRPRFKYAFVNNYKKNSEIQNKSTKQLINLKDIKKPLKPINKPIPIKLDVPIVRDVQKQDYEFAKKLFDSKEYKKSYAILKELFLNDLSNPNINFYLGQSAYKLGKYEEALSAYERILIVNEKAHRAKLEMALCYQQLGLPKEAKRILIDVRSDVPQSVRVNIDAYLAAIEDKRKKHSLSGAAILGLNYDSNIYGIAVDDGLLPNGNNYIADNASAGWAHQEVVAANYSYAKSETIKYKTDFVLFNKNIFDYSDMDLNLVQMTPAVSIMYSKNINVEYALFVNKVWLSSNPLMMNTGFFSKIKYIHSPSLVFDVSLKYQSQTNSSDNSDRDNNMYNLELGTQHFYTKELSFGAKAKFDFVREKKSGEDGDFNEVAYNLYELTLNSTYKYSPKIMFTPKLKMYQKSYMDPSISPVTFLEMYKRSDSEYQVWLGGTFVYSPKLLFTLELVHSIHNSNYADKKFKKDTLSTNVIIPF